MAFIRKVKTSSGATAVQIAYKVGGRIVKIIHIGNAHNKEEMDILFAIARKRLFVNQLELLPQTDPLQMKTNRSFSALLWGTLQEQYASLGFDQLNNKVFEALCLARIVEPTSKLDSLRVLDDLGIDSMDRNQLYRSLVKASWIKTRVLLEGIWIRIWLCQGRATHGALLIKPLWEPVSNRVGSTKKTIRNLCSVWSF